MSRIICFRSGALLGRLAAAFLITAAAFAADPLSPEDLLLMKRAAEAVISPDGEHVAYTVSVPRVATDEPGGAYSELFLYSRRTDATRAYITGKVSVNSVTWSPDGKSVAFVMRRGDKAQSQVWSIPVDGGEARQVTKAPDGVLAYRWHPSGDRIGYLTLEPKPARQRKLEEKGYGFIFYEENLRNRELMIADMAQPDKPRRMTEGINVWSFEFSPDGKSAAVAASKRNLVDESYMFQKIHLLDLESRTLTPAYDPAGKLGVFAFSPDGQFLAVAAAKDQKDHAVSQAYVVTLRGGGVRNLTPAAYRGHISWVGWKDRNSIRYRAGEGVTTVLATVKIDGTGREVLLTSATTGVVFNTPTFSSNGSRAAFLGATPAHPEELFLWSPGTPPRRITTTNPWLAERSLATQSVIRYKARDGLEIEGLLLTPPGSAKGNRLPLVVAVHGGPESHYSNGWISSYGEPGQVLAGKGYAVFYPNYRASTGYGVDFAMEGFGDPAGKEFDDIADGMEHLVAEGIADRERIGLGGGSYGGYAAAWFATYYTRYVRAVVMFVGISDNISRHGTTDIPYEELYVHSGKPLEEMWDLQLKRSPIYWARQSSTATLICGGADDTRVHPSQSLELYRRMKMNNHPAVRLVQYPGEQHGNRKQPGRLDYLLRSLDWYDWYVRDAKPLTGPMPPLDISERYGLGLE